MFGEVINIGKLVLMLSDVSLKCVCIICCVFCFFVIGSCEVGFVYVIMLVGVVYVVSKVCRFGNFSECVCEMWRKRK